MSANAIAAVTAALRNLLANGVTAETALQDTVVTTLPMDRAREPNASGNQLNLFLYQASPNAAWRNQAMPRQVQPLESGFAPLALNLYYLMTAYGRDNDAQTPFSHYLLGRAMSVIHDHPLLGSEEIRLALPENDTYLQIERIRFTLQPLSVEDIFKLWSGFQTQYRLSASYEAAVVLIESARAASAPLPVLTRGAGDTGPVAQASLDPVVSTISSIVLPGGRFSAQPGDKISIKGALLAGDKVEVLFFHPLLDAPISVTPAATSTATNIDVTLDPAAGAWAAGWYSVAVSVTSNPGKASARVATTSQLPMALAPTLTSAMPVSATIAKGAATLKLKCSPDVLPEQRVTLLLGDQQVPAAARTAATGALQFPVAQAVAGQYLIRLRVDGVDSLLVDTSVRPPVYRKHRAVLK